MKNISNSFIFSSLSITALVHRNDRELGMNSVPGQGYITNPSSAKTIYKLTERTYGSKSPYTVWQQKVANKLYNTVINPICLVIY